MPSARPAGSASVPRSWARNPTKPTVATANSPANASPRNALGPPRRACGRLIASSSECKRMWREWILPLTSVEAFHAKWNPLQHRRVTSIDIIECGEQGPPRCPGGYRSYQHRLRRQCQIAGRPKREGPEQGCELIPDRGAGKPAGDRFGEPECKHRDATPDKTTLQSEPEEMPQEPVRDVAIAGSDEVQHLDDRAVCSHRAPGRK